MPLYEYDCTQHGVFEAIHSIRQAGEPQRCPSCDAPSQRVLSAPRLACVGAHERIARDRNEKSQHEPRVSRAGAGAAKAPSERPALRASHSSRPWVLEHG